MSNLTNKVLQEISDLTKNMDVLVKELRSAREKQDKSADSVDKLAQNLTKFEEQKIKSDEESLSSQSVFFKNLTDSIQKSFEERDNKILIDLNKSLSLDIEKAFSDFPNKVAQIKSNDTIPTSDIIDQIASKTAEKTPGLKKGGEVSRKGLVVVGENGPELVELAKGDKVKNEEQILEKEQKEIERKKKAKDILNQDTEKLIITEKQKLEEKEIVVNSFGVKVPQKEIEKERESLKNLPKDERNEEIKSFIEGYRNIVSMEDIQKLNTKEDLNTQEKKDVGSIDSQKKIKDLETTKDVKKEGLLSKLKESAKNIVSGEKESFNIQKENLAESLKELKRESPKTTESTTQKNQETKNQMSIESVKGDLSKLAETNFKDVSSEKKEAPLSQGSIFPQKKEGSQQQAKTLETRKDPNVNLQSKKTGVSSSDNSSTKIDADMREIKGLLSAIYKALSGPLSISSDTPFRPNSNHL